MQQTPAAGQKHVKNVLLLLLGRNCLLTTTSSLDFLGFPLKLCVVLMQFQMKPFQEVQTFKNQGFHIRVLLP